MMLLLLLFIASPPLTLVKAITTNIPGNYTHVTGLHSPEFQEYISILDCPADLEPWLEVKQLKLELNLQGNTLTLSEYLDAHPPHTQTLELGVPSTSKDSCGNSMTALATLDNTTGLVKRSMMWEASGVTVTDTIQCTPQGLTILCSNSKSQYATVSFARI